MCHTSWLNFPSKKTNYRWWKRANHNKAQILYYFGENFDSRAASIVDKLELLTKKTRVQCEAEVKTCSNIIFHYASICDKLVGKLNVCRHIAELEFFF